MSVAIFQVDATGRRVRRCYLQLSLSLSLSLTKSHRSRCQLQEIVCLICRFETRVQRDDPASVVFVGCMHEASFIHHTLQFFLIREHTDALYKVLVRRPVTGDHLPDERNSMKGPGVIELSERRQRWRHGAKFETHESPTRL